MTVNVDARKTVLPARASVQEGAFRSARVLTLRFPFSSAIEEFTRHHNRTASGRQNITPPWRRLNNAFLACCPTLTCGFEQIGDGLQALMVIAPGETQGEIALEVVKDVLLGWLTLWISDLKKRFPHLTDDLQTFREKCTFPADWRWKPWNADQLAFSLEEGGGLGYAVVPALLAALLHDRPMAIPRLNRELRWRRVLSDQHTYLVSQPFEATYLDEKGKLQSGFFAYRLDFRMQTQAGRMHLEDPEVLHPWVFVSLRVQRYASLRLADGNFGRRVSVLLGLGDGLLENSPKSTALVRLQLELRNENWQWADELPALLSELKTRPLIPPADLLERPSQHGDLDGVSAEPVDRYLLVHAEGYEYGEKKGKGRSHAVQTGYSFLEKAAVFEQVFDALQDVLLPDDPLQADRPLPRGLKVLHNHKEWVEKQKFKMPETGVVTSTPVLQAIQRATQQDTFRVYLFFRDDFMLEHMKRHLRQALLGTEKGVLPESVELYEVFIEDPTLLDLHAPTTLKGKERDGHWRQQHARKCEAWKAFLQSKVQVPSGTNLALVELGVSPHRKGVMPEQNIRGAVREAMASHGLASQMIYALKKQKGSLEKQSDHRLKQATLDLLYRHPGVLLGAPKEGHLRSGLPVSVAEHLDVVGLVQRTDQESGIKYPVAVRICSSGKVEMLTPHFENWVPYVESGVKLGQVFSGLRSEQLSKSWFQKPFNLDGKAFAEFAERILTCTYDAPTVVVLEADTWRNEGKNPIWPQLKNDRFHLLTRTLDFGHLGREHRRNDPRLKNLLGVVRIRRDQETPDYVTGHLSWKAAEDAPELGRLSGFLETTSRDLLHYYSVGKLLITQKDQNLKGARNLLMNESWDHPNGFRRKRFSGASLAFKHQQLLEMVPFFVREDLDHFAGHLGMCRIIHQMRVAPSWEMGNIASPYPMHLAEVVLDDQLCILGSKA